MTTPVRPPIALFSLTSGAPLRERVAGLLGVAAGEHEEREFEDGEHKIRALERVRGRDVYVMESLVGESVGDQVLTINDKLARMLFFIGALRDAGARRITAIAPYLCYARKDRRTKPRDPVTTRYVATLFEAVGTDRMVVLDVHNFAAFDNAFRIPTVRLSAAPALAEAITKHVGERDVAVVSPDTGGVKRAEQFRTLLERRLQRPVEFALMLKFRSEGVVRSSGGISGISGLMGGPESLEGRAAVIVDDLIASGTTIMRAAAACRARGATRVYAVATHAVFSESAEATLRTGEVDRVLVTNSVPIRSALAQMPEFVEFVEVIDCAPLLAAAIARLHADGSVVELGY